MTEKNKKLEERINRCSKTGFHEEYEYCPYIPYASGLKCEYLGNKRAIPAIKDGIQGIRYAYGCNKILKFSKIAKRTSEYLLERGC